MNTNRIELRGRGARGLIVDAKTLRALLDVVVEGSQQAVRLVAQGRSRARGPLPAWIERATDFDIRIEEGSTVLVVETPTLREAAPTEFGQESLFPEIDPDRTSFDYLAQALDAVMSNGENSERFDSAFLGTLSKLESVFERGIEEVSMHSPDDLAGSIQRIRPADLLTFRSIAKKIPAARHVRTAGVLDLIRHSDRTFVLRLPDGETIRGGADETHLAALKHLWGKAVLVTGDAHFTASGKIQRIEAELIRAGSEEEIATWGESPHPLDGTTLDPSRFREPQGSRSGLAAIIGSWPGEESDEELIEALGVVS